MKTYENDGLCHNAQPGTFGHECGKPATWVGEKPSGFRSGFCDACKKDGFEARFFTQWTSLPQLERITQAEWNAIHSDYKSVWTTERTDWADWEYVRHRYMGKRTLMRGGSLGIEGISFVIVD